MWKWFSVMFVITSAAHGDALGQDPVTAIKKVIVEWNLKCWPLAFQTDEEQDPKTREECEAVAVKANKFFGFEPGGGAALSAEGVRGLFKIPLQALAHNIKPCNKAPHDPQYSQYLGKLVIEGGAKNEVCTAPIPNDLAITELTCEVSGGGLGRAPCANTGNTDDCGYAATISVYTRPSLKGNEYCWWVYHQPGHPREFSISVR